MLSFRRRKPDTYFLCETFSLFIFSIFHLHITTVVFIIIFIVIYFIFVVYLSQNIYEYYFLLLLFSYQLFMVAKNIYKIWKNIHFWIENSKPQKTARKFLAKSETRERHNHLLFLLTNVAHLKIVQAFVAHFPTLRKM